MIAPLVTMGLICATNAAGDIYNTHFLYKKWLEEWKSKKFGIVRLVSGLIINVGTFALCVALGATWAAFGWALLASAGISLLWFGISMYWRWYNNRKPSDTIADTDTAPETA